ncbi:hypothetical protein [Neobacillus drentensis]|uniref:hypothetical protein n=1 Tax=Neobacillus drentensis TaxID=220684 RepID=UPI002FFE9402
MFKKNEQGYALLTVLLIMTIFMILILSFSGLAFSNVKQNKVVEKNSQSVALAEMGISNYQVAVQNIYSANVPAITAQMKTKISSDRQANTLQKEEFYIDLGVSKMKEAIQAGLALEKSPVFIDGRTTSSFSIDSINYFLPNKDRKILFTVKGNENGKTTVLSSELTFAPSIGGLNNLGPNTLAPNFATIIEPNPAIDPYYCSNPASIGICRSISVSITPKTFTDVLNNSDTVTIFSKGELTLAPPSNANNMTKVSIHTEGNLTIGGNVQNASSIIFEVKGDLNVSGQLNLLAGSNIYVMRNVILAKNLFLDSGSKMCVAGTIDSSKIQFKGGLLIVKSQVSNDYWIEKCGIPPSASVEWGDRINNSINYNY